MNIKIKNPSKKLKYESQQKIEYKTTTFRLPTKLLKDLEDWVEESKSDDEKGSLNDLVRQIAEWALKHKGK